MTQMTSKSDQAILRLLSAAEKSRPVESEPIETSDYDWNVPCRFTPVQLDKLKLFGEQAATEIALKLGAQLCEEMGLWAEPLSQHYAGRLALLEGGAESFYFSITRENGEQCGLVVIPDVLARAWVGKALGGSDTASDTEHEFSTLESALMRDVVVAVVEALSDEYRMISSGTLQCGHQASVDEILSDAKSEDEYCVLAFRVGEEKDQAAISFILDSDVLTEVANGGITAQPGGKALGNSRENMLAFVGQAPVTATVPLMTVNLPMRQVINLEVGDVLTSDLCVGQPLELFVGGVLVSSGLPVTCDGQYALQIAT